jgi:hypothetical protein
MSSPVAVNWSAEPRLTALQPVRQSAATRTMAGWHEIILPMGTAATP